MTDAEKIIEAINELRKAIEKLAERPIMVNVYQTTAPNPTGPYMPGKPWSPYQPPYIWTWS
jgi:hypothetical protein